MIGNSPQALHFNTGRRYSESGQLIEAEVVETVTVDGCEYFRVRFSDKTRHINGEVIIPEFTQSKIMFHYDSGMYENV